MNYDVSKFTEPIVVRKWIGEKEVYRLVYTGVGFEMQRGHDGGDGYFLVTHPFRCLASILMLGLEEVDPSRKFPQTVVDSTGSLKLREE